ncbi:hypothetical protein SAMN04487939_11352 [Lysobacter sp. yr284]|uniref:hypothetical protein n=1 Tax=Lysobacter sp. yr284 TaxID=1761791 RepID=UPI00089530DE|nr:hypothetical protein [Lysobacter sp. yr284]SDZ04461.1 hypothetical protein SAMN04487939_11352 [Lysobacter sp. yr284]
MTSPETPTPQTPAPVKGGPNRRLAAQIDAREYTRHRPGPILLMGAAVIVALVLTDIVRTNLSHSQTEAEAAVEAAAQRAAAAAAAAAGPAATATGPNATDRIVERAFDTTLAELREQSAASNEARERTAGFRSQLQRTIAASRLELAIEQFECGPHLCIGSLLGDAAAYARFGDAIRQAQPPISAFADWSAAADADATRHRFLLPLNAGADADDAPAPARGETDPRP